MTEGKRTVLVTGVAGPLGEALVGQLAGAHITGTDLTPPVDTAPGVFCALDLGREESCIRLVKLLRETHVCAVVHLQSVDPVETHRDPATAWQRDVAGTARVLEAIAEVNRSGGSIRQFVMASSASAYGQGLSRPATEEARLRAENWEWAVNKRKADEVVHFWASSLGPCSVSILRAAIYPHSANSDYLLNLLRGSSVSERNSRHRHRVILPFGKGYLETPFQFVHIDDLARLIAWLLRNPQSASRIQVLNVAGHGEPLPLRQCLEIAEQRVFRVPGIGACRFAIRTLRKPDNSGQSEESLPYLLHPPLMDTSRLRSTLGHEYASVIRHTMEEALADSFPRPLPEAGTGALLAIGE
jgi:nucleoside-diphosphate-sugar epimerase